MISQLTIDKAKLIILDFIKKRQADLGMTDYRLSKLSGVNKGNLSKIMSGENTQITIDTYLRLCGALGIRPHMIVDEDDDKPYNYEHFN